VVAVSPSETPGIFDERPSLAVRVIFHNKVTLFLPFSQRLEEGTSPEGTHPLATLHLTSRSTSSLEDFRRRLAEILALESEQQHFVPGRPLPDNRSKVERFSKALLIPPF